MSRKPKTLVCRFCGEVCEKASQPDHLSGWTHNHPSRCPYRQDRMPSLNGVHVGDVWRNLHTKKEKEVIEIRLGGWGTYTDRESVVLFENDWMGSPLWSLVEHYEPVTRPGEYPVPWTRSRRFRGRSAYAKWRGPGYRREDKRAKPHAYWHAYHHVSGYAIEWERTNVLWQVDPVAEQREKERQLELAEIVELALSMAEEEREQRRRVLEFAQTMDTDDPILARVAANVAEMFAETA